MKIALLGSTGSVGRQTLEVVRLRGLSVPALAAGRNTCLLAEQVRALAPRLVAVADEERAQDLKKRLAGLKKPPDLVWGREGVNEVARFPGVDRVVGAISGFAGLESVLAAIEAGRDVALANKETLVAAGSLVMEAARRQGVRILPVDSEHAAIFQGLGGAGLGPGERIILTCSGGPFFGCSRKELQRVTPQQALQHPTWAMGPKITIDSATLMNKALELIEACVLFDAPETQIEVVVHPESLVHSFVVRSDGSALGILSPPDMRLPIQQALFWPQVDREAIVETFQPAGHSLHFHAVAEDVFPALGLARRAVRAGGLAPLALNAANEAAVAAFLSGRLSFLDIYTVVERALDRTLKEASGTENDKKPSLSTFDDMMEAHRLVYADAERDITALSPGERTKDRKT